MPETTEPQLTESDVARIETDLDFAVWNDTKLPDLVAVAALIRDWRAMKAENERLQADLKQSREDRDELSDTIEACHKMFDELDPDIEDGFTSLTPLEDRVREHLFPSDVITDDMVNGDD